MKVVCSWCQRYHYKPEGDKEDVSHTSCVRCKILMYKEIADQDGKELEQTIIKRLKKNIKEEKEVWEGEDKVKERFGQKYLDFYDQLAGEIKSESELRSKKALR